MYPEHMIKLETYIYKNNLRGLTKEEAAAFSMPWPIPWGWKKTYARYTADPKRLVNRGKTKKVEYPIQEDFFSSPAWRAVRYEALVKYGNACQCCGITPKHGAVLHVDHVKPRSKFPHLALSLKNLQILCEDCNLGKSNKFSTDWR